MIMMDEMTKKYIEITISELKQYAGFNDDVEIDHLCPRCGTEGTAQHPKNPKIEIGGNLLFCVKCNKLFQYKIITNIERFACSKCDHKKRVTKDETFGYSEESKPVGFCEIMESYINAGDSGDSSCFKSKSKKKGN